MNDVGPAHYTSSLTRFQIALPEVIEVKPCIDYPVGLDGYNGIFLMLAIFVYSFPPYNLHHFPPFRIVGYSADKQNSGKHLTRKCYVV